MAMCSCIKVWPREPVSIGPVAVDTSGIAFSVQRIQRGSFTAKT
jgi:hypothetical protein